jgi:2-methylcitrate dehydratase PrpD
MKQTYELVDFVVDVKFKDLDNAVVECTKKQVFDTLATMLGGSTREGIHPLYEVVEDWGGKKESGVIVFGGKFPAPNAAMVNAAMSHALDYDDIHDTAVIHSACVAVPSAFAVAQAIGNVSGKDLIAAIAAGVDIHCRFGAATKKAKPDIPEGGWHFTPLFGYFSSAAIASKLYGFDREKMINAFGIAYHQCAGNLQAVVDGSVMKRIGPGLASRGGIMAALMAGKGITGAKDIVESEIGIFKLYHAGYDEKKLLDQLGRKFATIGNSFKPYPCCRGNHPFIDGVLELVKKNDIKPAEVEEIIPVVSVVNNSLCDPIEVKSQPRNVIDSQFSIPWALACAVVRRKAGLDEFTDSALQDEAIKKMAKKVKPELDNALTDDLIGQSVKVKIKTSRGEFEIMTGPMLGSPENTLTFDMLEEKFRDCAKHAFKAFPEKNLKQVIDLVRTLEEVKDVGKIISLLA